MTNAWWRPADPGLVSLRRALRTAIVLPAIFAVFVVGFDSPQAAAFAAFCSFALLGFADFLGPLPRRAAAYAISTVVGAALVAIGTLTVPYAVLAGLGMGIVGFGARFATVYGGAFTPALAPVILSFALASTLEGDPGDIPARLIGWLAGGAVSLVAAIVLWPAHPRNEMRVQTANRIRALARLVAIRFAPRATDQGGDATKVRGAALGSPARSFGPGSRNRALVCLVQETDRLLAFLDELSPVMTIAAPDVAPRLTDAVCDTLTSCAAALDGRAFPIPVSNLDRAQVEYHDAVVAWTESTLGDGQAADRVLVALNVSHSLRMAALRTRSIAIHTARVMRLPVEAAALEAIAPVKFEQDSTARGTLTIASAHLRPGDVVFRNAVRSGVGVGLAVLIGGLVGVSHAFWVILATFLILRSSALGTGRTALQALVGTIAGFAIGAGFLVSVDVRPTPLWIALPVLTFFAAYAPAALSFMLGQAAFTLFVIDLFNILEPQGLEVAVVRVEDIALGAAISVVVGMLFWPRGARGVLGAALADAFRRGSDHLDATLDELLNPAATGKEPPERAALAAAQRAEIAFGNLLDEGGSMPVPAEAWGALLMAADRLRVGGEWLEWVADTSGGAHGCAQAQAAALADGHAVANRFRAIAGQLDSTPGAARPRRPEGARRAATLECLGDWSLDSQVRPGAMRALWADDWIQQLDSLADELTTPAEQVERVATIPWWR